MRRKRHQDAYFTKSPVKPFRRKRKDIMKSVGTLGPWLFGAALVAGLAWVSLRSREETPEESVQFVSLKNIEGISEDVIQAQGKIVNIAEPVQYLATSGVYLFEVRARGADYIFAGDSAKILHFVNEIKFLESQFIGWEDKSKEVLKGATQAVESMVEGLWNTVRRPIDTLRGLGGAVAGLYDYAKKYAQGSVNPAEDFVNFAEAYFADKCVDVANEHNLNFQELETSQAKSVFVNLAKCKIGGQVSVEALTLFMSFTKVPKVASLPKLGRYGALFRFGAIADRGALRATKFSASVRDITNLERLAPLLNPQRIATLAADRALNSRLNKVMYYLRQEELAGKNVSESLWRSMKMSGADKPLRGVRSLSHPKLDHAQLLTNYKGLKARGVFDVPGNMEALKRGGTVVPPGGATLDVNHIVPKSRAPELENCWSNLEYMDASENRSIGNSVTPASQNTLRKLRDAGALTGERVAEIMMDAGR